MSDSNERNDPPRAHDHPVAAAVEQLADALGGVDDGLDQRLAELRRRNHPADDPETLARALTGVAGLLRQIERRQCAAREPAAPARELLERIDRADLPAPLRKRCRELEATDPEPPWPDALRLLTDLLSHADRPGLMRRLFERKRATPSTPVEADAMRRTDIPAAARRALLILMDGLVLPETLLADCERLRKRLGTRLPLTALADTVESLTALIMAAAEEEHTRLESFLSTLTDRLENLGEHVTRSRDLLTEAGGDRTMLGKALQTGLSALREDVANDLPATARQRLDVHLETVTTAVDRYLKDEERRHQESEARVVELRAELSRTEGQAESLRNSLLQQQMRAQVDPLTQLANRAAYSQRLDYEYLRWRRHRTPLVLLFADVDRFKQVNDRYGHSIGDQILQAVAQTLKSNVRRTDLVARYGGEEFVILMPETDLDEASRVAEKLKHAVSEPYYTAGRTTLRVTMSFGLAEFHGSDRPDDVLDRADRALYEAKRTGRDRVVVAQSGL